MRVSFRVGDYWYISEGQWTLNAEHAAEWETRDTAAAAFRGIVDLIQRGRYPSEQPRRVELVTVIHL